MSERVFATARVAAGPRLDTTPPPPDLAPETFASRLYGMLAPLAQYDPSYGWSLLIFVNAIGSMFELVEEWVRDSEDGPGWSLLLDLDRCPPEALPWLAQFVGVRLLPDSTAVEQRARIASTDGFSRGTPSSIRGAAAATLTGTKTVVFRERYGGDAYALTIVTYTAETPDEAATRRAIVAQKPAGIVLDYHASAGQDWESVRVGFATWDAMKAAYPTWNSVKTATPGA